MEIRRAHNERRKQKSLDAVTTASESRCDIESLRLRENEEARREKAALKKMIEDLKESVAEHETRLEELKRQLKSKQEASLSR